MIKHHQGEMIRRQDVIRRWWRGIKDRQESDTAQLRCVKRRQGGVKGWRRDSKRRPSGHRGQREGIQ